MSNDKEIRIRAVLDASTFDKGVNEIQEKLKKLTQQQAQGAGTQKTLGKDSVMGKYAQQAFGDFSKESQKQLESMYQTQRREAVNQSVTMKGKEAELAKMAKIDGEMTKQQRERNENLKKEIELLKEKQRVTLNTAAETQKALDKMKGPDTGGPGGPGGPGGGGNTPPPPSSGGGAFAGLLKQIGVGALIKGALDAVVLGAGDMITRDRKINMNNAATMNMASREMREGMSGQGSRGMFWGKERAKAMRDAANEQGSQSTLDTAKSWGGTALQGVGLATTIATGWTGIGAAAGVGMMAAGTGLKGGIIGDERSRAAMFDRKKFNSMMTKEGMEKYEQNFAAEKAKDPRKEMAREYFEQNSGNMAAMQKMAGLSTDAELMGSGGVGMLQQNMKYGGQYGGVNFSQQTIQEQMQALASGGAMTSGIRDLSGAASTYNRQFNLSNAGQTMGKMQGNTGMNSAQTDMAYQRLLTEAVRLGVDTSSMPRELEKMTQMTAELTTSGGVNATGMGDLFGQAVTGFNDKALGAAAGAAEEYKSTSKAAGDWEGQMGYGFMQSKRAKEILGKDVKIGQKDMNYLNQTSAAELDEKGFEKIAAGIGQGVTPETIKTYLTEKDKYKQSRTAPESDALKALGEFKKKGGDMNSKEGMALEYKAGIERTMSQGQFAQQTQAEQAAELNLQSNVAADYQPGNLATAAEKVAAQKSKAETRAGNVEEGAVATGDMARIDALNEHLDSFKTAAKGYSAAAVEYNKQFELMVTATKSGATKMQEVADHLSELEQRLANDGLGGGVSSGKPPGAR